jgi:MinD-like ATPase involved in chromosome partitioning or flagellar assembly
MARASFVSPVYLYTSIKAGTGKASLIAGHSVYLSNSGLRVAIIDLDNFAPGKLKAVFPPNTDLQIYEDLAHILNARDSRYQRTFYFTDTQKISYFPGKSLPSPQSLFQDTSLRDFFLQTRATFDVVIVNFPSGDKFCLSASELLELKHLWHSSQPVLILLSTSESNCLLKLDGIMRKSPAISFQLRENALIVFNKVPGSLEEQRLSDNSLNADELKNVFKTGNQFFISNNEEFPHQKNISTPIVLNPDSLLNQCITRLNRLLKQAAAGQIILRANHDSEYQPTLDGTFLDKLSPYLAKIKSAAAARLFIDPGELMIFLEEANNSYRIRIRLTGQKQKTLGLPDQIQKYKQQKRSEKKAPVKISYPESRKLSGKQEILQRNKAGNLWVKPVYRFNDNFSKTTSFDLSASLDFKPNKQRYPSPILLRHEHIFPGIPTLSQILGFSKKAYIKLSFAGKSNLNKQPEVTHFFLPPEFDLWQKNYCLKKDQNFLNLQKIRRHGLTHELYYTPAYEFPEISIDLNDSIPDLFSRDKKQQFLQFDCVENLPERIFLEKKTLKKRIFCETDFSIDEILPSAMSLTLQPTKTTPLPKILPIIEKPAEIAAFNLFVLQPQFFIADSYIYAFADWALPKNDNQLKFKFKLDFSIINPAFATALSINMAKEKIKLDHSTKLTLAGPSLINHFAADMSADIALFIEPKTDKLPENFKLEISLLEQQLHVCFQDSPAIHGTINYEKSCPQTNITIDTVFTEKFRDIPEKDAYKKLLQFEKKHLKQKITPPQQDFRKIEFEKLCRPETQKWDILQVLLIDHKDSSYQKLSLEKAYRTDQICESGFQKLSPLNSGMINLQKHKMSAKTFLNKAFSRKLPKLKTSSPKAIIPEPEEKEFTEGWLTRIDSKSSKFDHHFSAEKDISAGNLYGSAECKTKDIRDVFAKTVAEPVLFLLPFHNLRNTLYLATQSKTITAIFEAPSDLVDFPESLQIDQLNYEYSLTHNEIDIPAYLPPRQKIYDAPCLPGTGLATSLTIIPPDTELQIVKTKIPDSFTQTRAKKSGKPYSKKGVTFRPYPLFKPLLNLNSPASPSAVNFLIEAPEPLDELYKNLLWNLEKQLAARFTHKIKPMTIKATELRIKQHRIELKYEENARFVRRILAGPSKLYLPLKRDEFSIRNPKLKDLLVLARLAGTKFKQVGSYSKS